MGSLFPALMVGLKADDEAQSFWELKVFPTILEVFPTLLSFTAAKVQVSDAIYKILLSLLPASEQELLASYPVVPYQQWFESKDTAAYLAHESVQELDARLKKKSTQIVYKLELLYQKNIEKVSVGGGGGVAAGAGAGAAAAGAADAGNC
jgi:hypothetical protein